VPLDLVRDSAVRILLRVFEHGAYVSVALDRGLRRRQVSERGRRFLTQLVYGTVRNARLCDHVLAGLLRQPLAELPAPIRVILRMGVYQALFLRQVTFPAMVHTSVDLAAKHGHAGTARLVNAVLRRVPERLEDVVLPDGPPAARLSVRYSMPEWLVEMLRAEVDGDLARLETLCALLAEEAPVTLRANRLRITREALCEGLESTGYLAAPRTAVPDEVTVVDGRPPVRSKLFLNGACMLQDPAAMLAARLVEPQPDERVLDLCSAPGGKTTHLSELADGKATIIAVDAHAHKLRLVQENVERLGAPGVAIACADGRIPPFRAQTFDRVLVDAPCSGLGTIRRRPEVKERIRPERLPEFAEKQVELLRSAVQLCKIGGAIIYAVCTFTPQETTGVMQVITDSEPVALEDGPPWMDQWKIGTGQYKTLAERDGLDGFYLMRLRKRS